MEYDKIIIWVPKDTTEIKVISKQKNGDNTEEKTYDENYINMHKITPFFEKLP